MVVAGDTKMHINSARLPTSSKKSTITMPIDPKSEAFSRRSGSRPLRENSATLKPEAHGGRSGGGPLRENSAIPRFEAHGVRSGGCPLREVSTTPRASAIPRFDAHGVRSGRSPLTENSAIPRFAAHGVSSGRSPLTENSAIPRFEAQGVRSGPGCSLRQNSTTTNSKAHGGRSVGRPLRENCTTPLFKTSRVNPSQMKGKDATGMLLSKTHQGFKTNLCDPNLPVHSVDVVDDHHFDLDLFKLGHDYDRALGELNLQPDRRLSTVIEMKPTIASPYDGSKFNPIQEAALLLNPSNATADISCGNVTQNCETTTCEESLTDLDSDDKCFTSPSGESICSKSICSTSRSSVLLNDNLCEKLFLLQQQSQEWDKISSYSSVSTKDLEETGAELGDFSASTLEKILSRLYTESGHASLKALSDELQDNDDPQEPLYWPLDPESYRNIEGCCDKFVLS